MRRWATGHDLDNQWRQQFPDAVMWATAKKPWLPAQDPAEVDAENSEHLR
jgi:hypothetical protein